MHPLDPSPTFDKVEHDHALYRFVMPMIAKREHVSARMDGTAFLICPGWAVTATHVVAEQIEVFERKQFNDVIREGAPRELRIEFDLLLMASGLLSRGFVLKVIGARVSPRGDITLLELDSTNVNWSVFEPFPALRFCPPAVGEPISALGLPHSVAEPTSQSHVNLSLSPRVSTGSVVEVHHEQRDRATLNFPCFRTDAKILGGMSGSPVIDSRGNICGVVSRSYDLEPDQVPISYMSTLWPMLCIPLLPPSGSGLAAQPKLLDLAISGIIATVDLDRICVGVQPNGDCQITLPLR